MGDEDLALRVARSFGTLIRARADGFDGLTASTLPTGSGC